MAALDLTSTYLHLGEGPDVTVVPVTPDFWPTIDDRTDLQRGRLVTSFVHDGDWDVWEMHPVGDEVIVVLGGSTTFHLDDDRGSVSQVRVDAPAAVVVPTGTWHTADVHEPGPILVITWGEGTQHRPRA
jgi:mannose-6-phosphate isomerase-like protein (cupin superfamily)